MASDNVVSIDDLNSVNAFLTAIGGSQVTAAQIRVPSQSPQEVHPSSGEASATPSEQVEDSDRDTQGIQSNVTSLAASPDPGRRAPPPTPAAMRAAALNTTHLEPVPEDDDSFVLLALAENSNQTLMDSMHAPRSGGPRREQPRPALASKSPNLNSIKRMPAPAIQNKILESMKGINLQDDIVKSFIAKNRTPEKASEDEIEKVDEGVKLSKVEGMTGSSDDDAVSKSSETGPFPTFEDHSPSYEKQNTSVQAGLSNGSGRPFSPTAPVWTPGQSKPSSQKLEELLANEAIKSQEAEASRKPAGTTVAKVGDTNTPVVVATPGEAIKEDPEDQSRPRKVILTGLPSTADNTLVASLLHGGTIEEFRLNSPPETATTTTATVLFADAEVAKKYYDTYPYGLEFKYGMRKHVAFVEMGKEVDVLSSLLRGHIEAGASRVVRATGADEDWGMRALSKVAEGKTRKVEGIADYWRDEVRTIVFRFTNIPDAVQFRGQLMRDYDWEMCNIQFVDDPCAKATGVHIEP